MGQGLGSVARGQFPQVRTMGVQIGPRSQNGNSSAGHAPPEQRLLDHEAQPGPWSSWRRDPRAGLYRTAKAHASVSGLVDVRLYLGSKVGAETFQGWGGSWGGCRKQRHDRLAEQQRVTVWRESRSTLRAFAAGYLLT